MTPKRFIKRRFLFGESERIEREDIPQFLRYQISSKSPVAAGATRKVALVGHQIANELDILEEIGINLGDQELYSIEGILDVVTIARALGLFMLGWQPLIGHSFDLSIGHSFKHPGFSE